MIKNSLFVISGIILLSFAGIKYDPEFREPAFFIKYRPNFTFNYYSPIGESDLTLEGLTGEAKKEELAYREFVGNYFQNDFLDEYADILIQLSVFLILFGSIKLYLKTSNLWLSSVLAENGISILLFLLCCILFWGLHTPGIIAISFYVAANAIVIYYFEKRAIAQHYPV